MLYQGLTIDEESRAVEDTELEGKRIASQLISMMFSICNSLRRSKVSFQLFTAEEISNKTTG